MAQNELLTRALQAFLKQTGLRLQVTDAARSSLLLVDLDIIFTYKVVEGLEDTLPIAASSEFGEVEHLLILPYVTSQQAVRLRAAGLGYLDAVGNAYLARQGQGLFVFVQGQGRDVATQSADLRRTTFSIPSISGQLSWPAAPQLPEPGVRLAAPKRPTPSAIGRPAALQLLYALLVEPTLLRSTYRTLANSVGVSPGAITQVFTEWQSRKMLEVIGTSRHPKRYWLQSTQELRQRWVEAFGDVLRPKLVIGRFRPWNTLDWSEWNLPDATHWGGEPAASLLLNGHLRPEQLTLYTRLSRAELMRHLRLIPDPQGSLTVLKAFEPLEIKTPRPQPTCVYPLLAYADLWLSRDPRNREVAELLANRYLTNETP